MRGPYRSASTHVVTSMSRSGCYRLERQLPGGICTRKEGAPFHGARRKSSKVNQDCTICYSCRWPAPNSAEPKWPGNRVEWREQAVRASCCVCRHRHHASARGIPWPNSTSSPGPPGYLTASSAACMAGKGREGCREYYPVRRLRRMAIARLPPRRASSIHRVRSGSYWRGCPPTLGCTGRTKAKLEQPSPSAVSGMMKRSEHASAPFAVRPQPVVVAETRQLGRGLDHEGRFQVGVRRFGDRIPRHR